MYVNFDKLFFNLNKILGLSEEFLISWSCCGFILLAIFYGMFDKTVGPLRFIYLILAIILGGPVVWIVSIVWGFFCLCMCVYDYVRSY